MRGKNLIYKKIQNSWFTIKKQGLKFFLNKLLFSRSSQLRASNFFLGYPTTIHIEVTTRCNLVCLQCPRQGDFGHLIDTNKDMPKEDFIKIFHKFPYLERIDFSGLGDSLLYPWIFEILEYIRRKNSYLNIFLSTNSTVLQDENKVKQILTSGINILQISWNGARAETVKKLQGITNFEKILNQVKLMVKNKRRGLSIYLNFVLMQENYQELVEYVKLAEFLGIERISVNRRNYSAFTDQEIETESFYSSRGLLAQIEEARKEALQRKIKFTFYLDSKCSSLWETVVINVDGEIMPCYGKGIIPGLFSLGNILVQDYSEIARSSILKSLRKGVATGQKPPLCRNCYFV